MMGKWLERKLELASIKGARQDLERFVSSLRGMPADELGMLLAVATIIRVRLQNEQVYPPNTFQAPLRADETAESQLRLGKLVRTFQKSAQPTDAAGAMVWLHSLRALNIPEVRELGQAMWKELERGFDCVPSALATMKELVPKTIPEAAWEDYDMIPEGLSRN